MIGDLILERMTWLGISQYQLAKRSGVGQGNLSKIISGEYAMPTRRTRDKIAKVLGITEEEYFRAAGVLPPDEDASARQPVPAAFNDAFTELDFLTDDEVVTYVESKPGAYFRAEMARQKERRTRASYVNLCRSIMRAWTSNAQLALDASLMAEK